MAEAEKVLIAAETNQVGVATPVDDVRKALAQGLVWLLVAAVAASIGLMIVGVCLGKGEEVWQMEKEWLGITFGPIVTLVGTVLGYYFGSK